MAMTPRILLFSAVGIGLYLALSLYHGHQLKKYPDRRSGAGKNEEKTWVQVSTTQQVTAGPVQPGDGTEEGAAGSGNDPAGKPQPGLTPATPEHDPQALSALQAELHQVRALLRSREEELRQARLLLERAQAKEGRAIAGAPGLGTVTTPAPDAEDLQRVATDRLQTELNEARARAAIAEGELERARMKAEAMYRYGQEQSRLLAPARQEAESLRSRLQVTGDRLRQAEQEVAALRGDGPKGEAPVPPAGGPGEPTSAAERGD